MDHRKCKGIPEKHLLLLHWLRYSLWLCRSQQTGKFLKRWEYQTTLSVFWENCMQVKKQQLELYMEQWTGKGVHSKLGEDWVKAVYCHPACLTSMQSISCEMLGWMNHKLESSCQEKYQQLQTYRWYHPNVREWRGTVKKEMKMKWKWKRRVKKLD